MQIFECLPQVLFWTLPFRSRQSLRVPGDTGMRTWTKDVQSMMGLKSFSPMS